MVISTLTLYLLLLVAQESLQKSSPASPTYRAAVVELGSVFYNNDPAKTLNDNAERIVDYLRQAAEKDVDIIVFPELVLPSTYSMDMGNLSSRATLIPDPSQNYTPCRNSGIAVDKAIKTIACAAERNSIYVVVNLLEKETCSGNDCPSEGISLYVTSVVFDRNGKIIARYRKGHLLDDPDIPLNSMTEISTFDTDFGVTFGNIICMDIMYEEPLLTLTRELNITDLIHPSGWFMKMPFLSTIQTVSSLAYAEDVNILSSGINKIQSGYSGSGIYAGRQGVVTAILPLDDHEEMLVADVLKKSKTSVTIPKSQHNHEHHYRSANYGYEHRVRTQFLYGPNSDRFKWLYEDINGYTTKIIPADGLTVQKLNHSGIECEFQVNVTHLSPRVTYRLVAYDGRHFCHGTVFIGIRVCAIVQCANDTIDSCGHLQNSSSTFNSISITALYVDNPRTLLMPNTLGSDLWPLDNWTFDQYKREEHIVTTISLTRPTENLVTFGIWGRNFEIDTKNG